MLKSFWLLFFILLFITAEIKGQNNLIISNSITYNTNNFSSDVFHDFDNATLTNKSQKILYHKIQREIPWETDSVAVNIFSVTYLNEASISKNQDLESLPVEHRVDLVYQGVVEGWIPLTRWIDVIAETPAKISGLYPKKGTIAPGSDADVVVYNPAASHVLSASTHHMNLDYSVFEGAEVGGAVETVLSRGDVIVDGGAFTAEPGRGRYLVRGTNAMLPERITR